MAVTSLMPPPTLEREVRAIEQALDEHGVSERQDLARLVGARYWGSGVFRAALRQALAGGTVRRESRSSYAPLDEED